MPVYIIQMSTTRTDTHRPSAIIPADYEYVCCEYTRGDFSSNLHVCESERSTFNRHQQTTGGHILHEEGSPCDVCGSPKLVYGLLFYHSPSNAYVRVGEDCAYKLGLGGGAKFNAFKRALREQAEVYAGKQKAQRILADKGLSALWDIAFAQDRKGFAYEENTITDIVGKLVRYGSVSDKALAFAESLLGKIGKRAEIAAQRAAEQEAAAPCPTGRIVVTGTVLSTKGQDSPWGYTIKMLVRDDSGFKVWCTVPVNDSSLDKGDRISFTVSVEPSRDDPKFGFGKRPAKLTNLTAKAQQVEQVEESVDRPGDEYGAPHDETVVPDVASNRDDYYANR